MWVYAMLGAASFVAGWLGDYFCSQDPGKHERARNESTSKPNKGSANSKKGNNTHDQDLHGGMAVCAIVAAVALAVHYFRSQDEGPGEHERARNKSTSKPNEGSVNAKKDSHTHDQDLHQDSNPEKVKGSSSHIHKSVDNEITFVPSNDAHHQDQERFNFIPTSVPTYFEHYPNFEGQQTLKKESHHPKTRECPNSTSSTLKSTNSTTTSKSSSTSSLKPTVSEIVESKREEQKEKPSKWPPDLHGVSPSPSSPSSDKFPPTFKPKLSKVSSSEDEMQNGQGGKEKYLWLENDSLPLYLIPEDVKDLIQKDIVPEVLMRPLTRSTYKDYFAALLYAEEYYHEVH